MSVFFSDADYQYYLKLLGQWSTQAGLSIWAFCLMPNHVHLLVVPATEKSLHNALRETHRRYSCHINKREGWTGYLWQGRFSSFPMDDAHAYHAFHYVENNPVRAGLADAAEKWPWSSAFFRHNGENALPFFLITPPMISAAEDRGQEEFPVLRKHCRTGRPLGSTEFVSKLEIEYKRVLLPQKRGPKAKPIRSI